MKIYIVILVIIFSGNSFASNICETSFNREVGSIFTAMSGRKDKDRWVKYEKFLNKFNDCLDGIYAETVQGISEDALADDWKGFVAFMEKAKPSKKVLISIEMGFSPEMGMPGNLKKIKENAKKQCSPSIKKFCKEILK